MSARDIILRAVRAAQRTATLPIVPGAPDAPVQGPHTIEECLARFGVEAAALGVECYVEDSRAAVQARLAELVAAKRVLSWALEHLPYDCAAVLSDSLTPTASLDEQATADVGVTGCDAAIAETASLVLISAPGRPRTVSLLPPFHVAVVERRHLCFSMSEVFALHGDRISTSASCTFVTGPSRTADIELTLTLGIHGPGRVAVIVGP